MPKNKNSKRTSTKKRASRKFGVNLWGKANDPFLKKNYRPGMHGTQQVRNSEYGKRLKEKNKLKTYYNMLEKQFKNLFKKAKTKKGDTAQNFVGLLESRLMTVVYRANFVPTIFASRQIINHKRVLVNGKVVNIGSYLLKEGDIISLSEKGKKNPMVMEAIQTMERDVPDYLEVDPKKMTIKFSRIPMISEIPYPVEMNLSLIVEYYSR